MKNQIEVEMMYNAQVRQRKVEMTLGAMNSLGAHLAGIPGRKNLVWIGGGISMLTITGAMGFGPKGDIKSHESIIRDSSRKLAQQNIALYAVDARGLTGPTDASASLRGASTLPGRGLFDRQQQAETISADPLPAAESMAEITGGRVIRNTNDPAEGMKQADNDVMGAYTLGFYAGEPDGRWHGLKVRLKRPGVKIVYREGFFAEAAGSMLAEWSDADWQSAIRNPLGSTAISIDARCGSAPGDDPQALAAIVQVEPRHLYFQQDADRYVANVEFAIAEKMPSGQSNYHRESGQFLLTAEQYGSRNPANVRYSRSWKPAPGVSSIRVLVRDRITGRYGALDMPVARIPQSSRPSQLPTQ